MVETTDDSETFAIGLTEGEVPPEPSKIPVVMMMLGAAAVGLYILLRR